MKTVVKRSTMICLMLLVGSTVYAQKPELIVQTGHSSYVTSVTFNPDGNILASGSGDQTIKLWDVATGKELRTLTGHSSSVTSVAFNPDGNILASGSGDQTIKLWDVTMGKELRTFTLTGHYSSVESVTFSPDGKLLASGCGDDTIKLWDVATGKKLHTFTGHSDPVNSVAFSPDGKFLASGSGYFTNGDYTIKLWDVATGKELRTLTGHSHNVTSVTFNPDGNILASGSADKTIKLWDVTMGKELRTFTGHSDYVNSVAFSPDGKILASGSYGETKLWDVATGKELHTFESVEVSSVAFSSDGKILASGGSSYLTLWDVATGKELHTLKSRFSAEVYSVDFNLDGKILASGSLYTIQLWDVSTGKEFRTLTGHSRTLNSVTFNPDGKILASGSADKTIKLWDVATGKELRTLSGHSDDVDSVTFSPDGNILASGGGDNTIKLWDVATGKELRTLTGHSSAHSVTFNPDGNILASGSGDQTIKLWDVATGRELRTLTGHSHPIHSVTFSPDGKILTSGGGFGDSGEIKFWDVTTGKNLRTLTGHSNEVTSVAFSPDGKILATGSSDLTIKLWNVATGKELRTLTGHSNEVTSVAFSPDGKLLASGSKDTKIKLWEVSSGKELASLIWLGQNDWVVVAPDGRFDGSPDGMKLMHYVQDNQPILLDAFFEQFYTPKLLAQVYSGEAAPVTPVTVDFSKPIKLPPLVKITSPKAGESFNTDAIQIMVEATDQGGGIDEIRLYQNGKLVSEEQRGMKKVAQTGIKITKTFNVTLVSGMNEFRATAFNTDRTESNPGVIFIELKAAQASANLYFLAIGINTYKNSRYNLNYGVPDAQAFVQAVEGRGVGIFKQILKQEIYDEQATREAIEAALSQIISNAKPQDAFVFYYAGHGVMSEGDETTPPEFYLVPTDVTQLYGNDALLASRAISAKQLKEWCAKIQAQKQLVVFDACQSGGAVEVFAMRGAAEEKAIAQLARSAGVVVLAATGTEQFATEFAQLGHGVFTYALLVALSGDADGGTPPDGKITVKEMAAYLEDKVPELTKRYRGTAQYPNSYARGQDFPLGVR